MALRVVGAVDGDIARACRSRLDRLVAEHARLRDRMRADRARRGLRVVVVGDFHLHGSARSCSSNTFSSQPDGARGHGGNRDPDNRRLPGHPRDSILLPVRILTVGNGYPPHHHGGYELVWHAAVEHLRSGGHEVEVLTTDTRTGSHEAEDFGVHRELRWHLKDGRFQRLGFRGRLAMARHNHRTLAAHLDRYAPDVVGWWSMGGLSLTMLEAVRRAGLPATAFVHDEWLDYGRWADPWLQLFTGPRRGRLAPFAERLFGVPTSVDFGGAGEYVFVSEFTRRHAQGLGLGLTSTSVAHSGVHESFLDPAPSKEWGWRLLCVGRIDPRKGLDVAISAMPRLPAEATLTIAGSWIEAEEHRLRELAIELGVGDRVRFEGTVGRATLKELYGAADVIVFPVRWNEPWGLVPLEAMGRGRPVVATGRGGSGEYLRDGVNCLLFDPEDVGALANAVRRLSESRELRATVTEAGSKTASQFTEARFNSAVEQAFLRAVAQPAEPVAASGSPA